MLVPKLRFKEFTDEWASDNIGNFCNILMCKRIFADQTSLNEEIPFYKIGTIGSKPDTFISRNLFEEYKKKYNYPRYGELLITCSGTVGKCTIFDGKDSYYQDSNIVWIDNPTLKISNSFLYYLVSKVDWSKLNSTTIVRIYNDNLRKLNLKYPANKNEQEKITKVMMLIDKKIELQSKKIEVLKLYSESTKKILFSDSKSWEYKKIKEIIKYERPDKYIVKRTEYSNKFDIPVLTANKGFILGYTNEKDNIYKNNSIIFDDFTMDMKYVNFPFKIKSSAIKILTSNNNLLFLYESIKNLKLVSSEHKRHYIEYVQEFDIPIPSLEKQEKIAKIINCFNQKILNENKKIEQLNNLKIGLMQSMFV